MRERNRTLRRGPKYPLPSAEKTSATGCETFSPTESNYYTIDNTEEIYGTNILPSQRCYVDPWDLENYDYVRKKIASSASPPPRNFSDQCETSMSPSPNDEPIPSKYFYVPQEEQMTYLSPINSCNFDCCSQPMRPMSEKTIYGTKYGNNYNLMSIDEIDLSAENSIEESNYIQDGNLYSGSGYGAFSTSSSTGHNSSCGDDINTPTIVRRTGDCCPVTDANHVGGLAKAPRRSVSKLEYPVPLPMPAYDYCSPYARLDLPDCYECLAQHHNAIALLSPGPTSLYGSSSIYGSTLGRRNSSSIYSSGYSNKFGLSKKGLLQIDYSYSWNDLHRVIGRNY